MTFKQLFFRLYDSKIASGEIRFSQIGIRKDDFTRLCTEEGFALDDATLAHLRETMHLTPEEYAALTEAAKARRPDGEQG